ITATLKDGSNQVFVFPCEAAKKDRHPAAFFGGEGALNGTMEVRGRVESRNLAEPHTLGCEALLNFLIQFNVYESGARHEFLQRVVSERLLRTDAWGRAA